MESHEHVHSQNRFAVIPTADKLNANKEFRGSGVTIAFLDSGFYPHPDFADRVLKFHDISGEEKSLEAIIASEGHHWHGTRTVVSCAGNGLLSDGVYRGLASEAKLVLVKVSEKGGQIPEKNIEKGLKWVIENREKYNVNILNISLGGDVDEPTSASNINQLVEQLTRLGVVITAAAGNSAEHRSIPPATSPSAITVGGFSDQNQFEAKNFELYHSSFGETADGIVKPEIIAPAMFIAAPILPKTAEYRIAETLSFLANVPDYQFCQEFLDNWRKADLPEYFCSIDVSTARSAVEQELKDRKIISTHYQHVDGTSFAAPITASVVAQMIEANSGLTPATIKNILVSTASRLAGFSAIRQGFGVLNAGLAVQEAARETHSLNDEYLQPRLTKDSKIIFSYHNDYAENVCLVGDFNDWDPGITPFVECADGLWEVEIPCLPIGRYRYKFVIDGQYWTEDTNNGVKEGDGYGGITSILNID